MDIKEDRFKHIRFERSRTKGKKYDAIIEDKVTRRQQRVPFGDVNYQHYKDSTGLKLFSRLDHNDPKRRANYKARHEKTRHKKFSASWYADRYLW